jgi:hypothetical protein
MFEFSQWLRRVKPADVTEPMPRKMCSFTLAVERLEDRTVPAGNIAVTGAYLVNASNQPLTTVAVGQPVYVHCDFTASGLPSNASYNISYTVNGVTETSSNVTWGAGSSGTYYCYMYWGAWTAQAGTNSVSVTVDAASSVPESSYSDNSTSFTFTTTLPSIQITSVSLVNANDQPVSFVAAGQPVYVEANYTTSNLPAGATYRLTYHVDGVTLTTGPLTLGTGASGTQYCYMYWGTFAPAAGDETATVTVNVNEPCSVNSGIYDFTAVNANPTAAKYYSPLPMTDTLFGPNGPSYLDVHQGGLGDCWVIASLAEVAARDPQAIENMFTYDGIAVENGATVGLYTVRFFNGNNVPVSVTVDTELPEGGNYYDVPVNGVMWVALAEKAYAIANGLGYVTVGVNNSNSYSALNGGQAGWTLQAILGTASSFAGVNPTNIAAAWNAGDFIVLTATTPNSSEIEGSHVYAVVSYNPSVSNPYLLMNPWGDVTATGYAPGYGNAKFGLFSCDATFLAQNFNGYFTAGAANSAINHPVTLFIMPNKTLAVGNGAS